VKIINATITGTTSGGGGIAAYVCPNFWVFDSDIRNPPSYGSYALLGVNPLHIVNTNFVDSGFAGQTSSIAAYYYPDILVKDANGVPVTNAAVSFTNTVDIAFSSVTALGDTKTTFNTNSDGRLVLPKQDRNNAPAIAEYYSASSGIYKQFKYTITASKDGYSGSVTNIAPNTTWYRSNPNVPTNTILITIPYTQTSGNATAEKI